MLNVAMKQKRISDHPRRTIEFPATASEQAKIEFAVPGI